MAFNDPVLRAAGLRDDSYGEAKRFFELTDRQLHWLVCYCHYGQSKLPIVQFWASGRRADFRPTKFHLITRIWFLRRRGDRYHDSGSGTHFLGVIPQPLIVAMR